MAAVPDVRLDQPEQDGTQGWTPQPVDADLPPTGLSPTMPHSGFRPTMLGLRRNAGNRRQEMRYQSLKRSHAA